MNVSLLILIISLFGVARWSHLGPGCPHRFCRFRIIWAQDVPTDFAGCFHILGPGCPHRFCRFHIIWAQDVPTAFARCFRILGPGCPRLFCRFRIIWAQDVPIDFAGCFHILGPGCPHLFCRFRMDLCLGRHLTRGGCRILSRFCLALPARPSPINNFCQVSVLPVSYN
jgi:hypothetical protein